MATYTTSEFAQGSHKNAEAGFTVRRIAFTLSSVFNGGAADVLKVCRLPKGATLIPPLCSFWSSNDPASANCTAKLQVTDGTTTKDIIGTGNIQAADTPVTGTFTGWAAIDFFKTGNKDFYVRLLGVAGADACDVGTQLKFVITYATDGDVGDQIT